MKSTLEGLLEGKKHKIDIDAKKWIQKRDEWIERVEKLYKKIHGWLKPFEEKKLLRIAYTEIQRREELLGDYSIKKMTFSKKQILRSTKNVLRLKDTSNSGTGMRTADIFLILWLSPIQKIWK